MAFPVAYSDPPFYVGVVRAKDLDGIATVARADEDPAAGYQRHLNKTRMNDIQEYLNAGNVIPGALIVNARDAADLTYDTATKTLSLKRVPGSLFVVDGQHRLFGAINADVDATFPICMFDRLSLQDEVRFFLDVNGNQRGVPRTLQLEILKFLDDVEPADKVRQQLFADLGTTPTSPLCGKTSPNKSVRGKLSHVPFETALRPLFEWPHFADLPYERKLQLLEAFLNGLNTVLQGAGRAEKITNAAFFMAIFGAFKDIALLVRERHSKYSADNFADVLQPIADLDWDSHSGTNKAAVKELTSEIVRLVMPPGTKVDQLFT